MSDELTRQVQDLVDQYGATGVADIPLPERDGLIADKLREDATDNPWQTLSDCLEDASETNLMAILARIGNGIQNHTSAESEREVGMAVVTLARQRYGEWLERQVTEAATTSRARQIRKMADLETDARIHARKEANHG